MHFELMYGQKPVMPIEEIVFAQRMLPWKGDFNKKIQLLGLHIQQLERWPKDIEIKIENLKEERKKNKEIFDKTHQLWHKAIEESDWVLVNDNSLDNQHNTLQIFSKHWIRPYIVIEVYINSTYL